VPPQRSATQRRSRRLAKTDAIDAVATARALLAEPTLGPVQTLEVYDPLVAELEAVLEHRRALVETRTLLLHHVGDQLAKLPTDVRDQLPTTGKLESRLRNLETITTDDVSTRAGTYRLSWLIPLIDRDRHARQQIRQLERRIDELLDEHGTTLRDESGVGPIIAATLICEVGDPFRFAREAKFARWSGTGAVALSSGEGNNEPVRHRLDIGGNRRVNSMLYIISVNPTTRPSRRAPLSRAQSRRRQDPPRSPTCAQTPAREPRHPAHVARRTHRHAPLASAA
jgi:transposase